MRFRYVYENDGKYIFKFFSLEYIEEMKIEKEIEGGLYKLISKDKFIGLYDKGNNEIYERDIVENDGALYLVEWGVQEAGFYLYNVNNHMTFYFNDDSNDYSIVGNYYMNKETME